MTSRLAASLALTVFLYPVMSEARGAPQAKAVAGRVVNALTVGKKAPEIAGADLDGRPMRLTDFQGRVVLLVFSGDWCGICRSEYPYERFLQELYRNWPFAIVSVNSDPDVASAKRAMAANGLMFRSWWDGAASASGTIATAWGVDGWPTTYLIDANGTIRFVDLRSEDLLKGVKQLLAEMPAGRGRPGTPQN
jgi:peroxiredoxin